MLLELAGLPVPQAMPGKPLTSSLQGASFPDRHRKFARSKCCRALAGGPGFGPLARSERFKPVASHGHGLGELLDLEADPGEVENLWEG